MSANAFTTRSMQSEIISDELSQRIIADMGYTGESERAQAFMLADVGEILLMRLTLEMLKKLPLESADKFEKLVGAGDMQAIRDLMAPHVYDLDGFIQETIAREYEKVKEKVVQGEPIADDAAQAAYTYL